MEIIKGNTDVDVAASDDKTGNHDLNADWELEITKGDIEASPLSVQMDLGNFNETLQIAESEIFSQLDTNFVSQPIGSGGSTVFTRDGNFALSNIYKNDAGEPFLRVALNEDISDGTTTSIKVIDFNNYLSNTPAGHTVSDMFYGSGAIKLGFEMTGAESVGLYSYSYNQASSAGYGGMTLGVNSGDRVVLNSGSEPALSYFNNSAYTVADSYFAFGFQDNNINAIENYVAGMRIYGWLPFKYASTNNSPIFSSPNSATVISNTDVSTVILDVDATNGDGGGDESDVTYSISGTDADDFVIDPDDGELRFVVTPNHASPTDANLDNVYDVIVTANDGGNANNITDQSITITVDAPQVSAVDIVVSSSTGGTLTEQELTTAGITQTGLSASQVSIIEAHVAAANPAPTTGGELQTIVDVAIAEESAVNAVVSSSNGATLTEQELTAAGVTQSGLSASQVSIIEDHIAAANPAPTTSGELQTIVDAAIAEGSAVNIVVSSSNGGVLTEQELTAAGVTQSGLSADQVSIIEAHVAATNPVPTTSADVQTIVDAAIAEESAVNIVVSSSIGKTLTEQELTDAGITQTGLSVVEISVITDHVIAANPAPNTIADLQSIVDDAFIVLSVDDLSSSKSAVVVYPNPSVGHFTIEHSSTISIINIDLLDLNGVVLQNIGLGEQSGGQFSLDVDASAGVYLLRIETSSQVVIERVTIE